MKLIRLFFFAAGLLCINSLLAQEGPPASADSEDISKDELNEAFMAMFNVEIEIDLPESAFEKTGLNNYLNEEKTSMVSLMKVPQNVAHIQEDFEKKKDGLNISHKEMFEVNGKTVMLQESSKKDESDGRTYVMQIFCMENSDEDSIMISAIFPEEHADEFKPIIRKALNSVKIK